MKQCPICTTNYPNEHTTCPTDGAVLLVTSDWSPGALIRGKYRIIAKLGRGGMGTVYKAEHIALEEVRALKVMTSTGDAEFVQRFRREAQAARRLRHPNVVHVDDLDQTDDGSFFIAMDYVDGVSLRQLMQATQGPLPLMRTIGIVRSVADALAAAHALGMVHRDIKPENILLARDAQGRDVPKILDFGIVAMKEFSSTLSTRYMLTPAQGSPEQWKGMKSSELDGRADLYALGVVWYEMLTGRLPLHAHSNEGWMRAHLEQIPEPPSKFNPELVRYPSVDALVLKLLAKDREQRPRDAQALLGELNLIETQLSWTAAPAPAPSIMGDATAIFRPSAKEAVFQTPAPSLQPPPAQPRSEDPSTSKLRAADASPAPRDETATTVLGSSAKEDAFQKRVPFPLGSPPPPPSQATSTDGTAIYKETLVQSNVPIASPIAKIAATPAKATPSRRGSRTFLILIASAVVASVVLLGVIYRFHDKVTKATRDKSPSAGISCDEGDTMNCIVSGDMYRDGQGVAKDENQAVQLYKKGCDWHNVAGCINLGNMYRDGQGVEKDGNRAAQLYQDACDLGDPTGCANALKLRSAAPVEETVPPQTPVTKSTEEPPLSASAGNTAKSGGSTSKPPIERMKLGGDVTAASIITQTQPVYPPLALQARIQGDVILHAIIDKQGKVAKLDVISGPPLLRQSALDAVKQWVYKPTELNGAPVEVDTTISVKYAMDASPPPSAQTTQNNSVKSLQDACDRGNAASCNSVGVMYANGQGVPRNYDLAFLVFQKSCSGSDARGCNNLGIMYQNGWGVVIDDMRALQYYQKGCDLGGADGCANKNSLNNAMETSRSSSSQTPQNSNLESTQVSCRDAVGCLNLGAKYEDGQGVEKNEIRAAQFLQKACDLNSTGGCVRLGFMYENGHGVGKNESRAAQYFQKGCDLGSTVACGKVKK